jgi:hypothetical protein
VAAASEASAAETGSSPRDKDGRFAGLFCGPLDRFIQRLSKIELCCLVISFPCPGF